MSILHCQIKIAKLKLVLHCQCKGTLRNVSLEVFRLDSSTYLIQNTLFVENKSYINNNFLTKPNIT